MKTAALVSLLSLPLISSAATNQGSVGIKNPLGDGNDNLFKMIDTIIDALLKLGAVLAVIAIIFAGFKFVTAGGDEGKLKTAKAILLYTVIGIVILLGARIISAVVVETVTSVGKDLK